MLQREVPSGLRANKKLPAAASRHLLNDVGGIFCSLMSDVTLLLSHIHTFALSLTPSLSGKYGKHTCQRAVVSPFSTLFRISGVPCELKSAHNLIQ
jgi:hypothetical protein